MEGKADDELRGGQGEEGREERERGKKRREKGDRRLVTDEMRGKGEGDGEVKE